MSATWFRNGYITTRHTAFVFFFVFLATLSLTPVKWKSVEQKQMFSQCELNLFYDLIIHYINKALIDEGVRMHCTVYRGDVF